MLRTLLFIVVAALLLFLFDTYRNSSGDIWKLRLDSQIDHYIRSHPGLSASDRSSLRAGRVVKGWNREKCRVAWGEPDEILHLTQEQTEIWQYEKDTQPAELIFTNGFLTGWYP